MNEVQMHDQIGIDPNAVAYVTTYIIGRSVPGETALRGPFRFEADVFEQLMNDLHHLYLHGVPSRGVYRVRDEQGQEIDEEIDLTEFKAFSRVRALYPDSV